MGKQVLVVWSLLFLAGCGAGSGSSGNLGSGTGANSAAPANTDTSARLLPPPPPSRPVANSARLQSVLPRATAAEAIRPRVGPLVVSLQTGWNQFSMPYSSFSTFNVSDPGAFLACYRYDTSSGQYLVQDQSQAGFARSSGSQPFTGYWGYASRPLQITAEGTESSQATISSSLAVGWNLVGTPLADDVPLTDLRYNSQSLTGAFNVFALWPDLLTYNPATSAYVSNLRPPGLRAGQAVWLYAFQAGTLQRPVQAVYDAVQDFSLASNPNGAYSYGDLGSLTAPTFAAYAVAVANVTQTVDGQPVSVGGLQGWAQSAAAAGNTGGEILKNTTAASLSFQSVTLPTNQLGLQVLATAPDLRFTAPASGKFTVRGFFDRIDTAPQPTNVAIFKNLTTTLHRLAGLNSFGAQDAFTFAISLLAGDVLDFAAMAAGAGGHNATGLNVVITRDDPAGLTFTVTAKNNIYGAQFGDAPNPGEPSFGQAGGGTVAPFYDFNTAPSDAYVTFPSVLNNNPAPNQSSGAIPNPDGYLRTQGTEQVLAYRGLSGAVYSSAPYRSFGLVGVFTNPASTSLSTPPAGYDFSLAGESRATNSPLLNQVFFIGDGLTGTGSGVLQQFAVPAGATRLTLGFADSAFGTSQPSGYQDNAGSLNVTVVLNSSSNQAKVER